MDAERTGLGIEQIAGIVRRRAPWIVLCVVLVAAAAYGFSKHQTRKYTATAALVFNNNQQAQQLAGLPVVSNNTQQAQQSTNVKLVELGDMAAKTASQLGDGLTKAAVSADIGVSAQGESNIVSVAATASSPHLAAAIANTYAQQFVGEQQNSDRAYYASALALVNRQLAALSPRERASTAGIALQNRAQSLGVLAELRNGNVQVAQTASVPTSPSSPKVLRNTILGTLLGLLLGLGVALLMERFDRTIADPQDLERIYGLPLLGVIPESTAIARSSRAASQFLPPAEAEAFQLIRAHLRYFNVDRKLRALLVASAAPKDGKTTVARHLATATAIMGSRVLLVEADLRRPTLAKQLDIRSGPGLCDVLIDTVSMDDATQSIDVDVEAGERSRGRTLDVLVGGAALPPNPGELMESSAMQQLLERVKCAYDLVVIDTPPMTMVSDAFPLLGKVDGVVIVGRLGHNHRDVAERMRATLAGTGVPLLGVIANGLKTGRLSGYGSDYSYAHSASASARRAQPTTASPNGVASTNGTVATEDRVAAGDPVA